MEQTKNLTKTQSFPLLKEVIDYGIIDADSVLDMLMSNKREQVLKIHPYAITPPTSEDGRWQTTYKEVNGKRRNIKAPSKEALLDKLIPFYFSNPHADKDISHTV